MSSLPDLRLSFGRLVSLAAAVLALVCAGCVYAPPAPYPYYPYPAPAQTYAAPATAAAPAAQASQSGNCREYQKMVMIDGKDVAAYGTACQQPDGTWRPVQAQ